MSVPAANAPTAGKSLITSKTFWVNVIGGLGQVIGLASGVIPEKWAPIGAGVQAILNIFLRLITNQPITGVVSS